LPMQLRGVCLCMCVAVGGYLCTIHSRKVLLRSICIHSLIDYFHFQLVL
jgi:hypothetical protein